MPGQAGLNESHCGLKANAVAKKVSRFGTFLHLAVTAVTRPLILRVSVIRSECRLSIDLCSTSLRSEVNGLGWRLYMVGASISRNRLLGIVVNVIERVRSSLGI